MSTKLYTFATISPGQVDVGRTEIREFSPPLYHYIAHLHIALSRSIAATGLATAALAWYGVRRGELRAYMTAIAAPGQASPSRFPRTTRTALISSATCGLSTRRPQCSSSEPPSCSNQC